MTQARETKFHYPNLHGFHTRCYTITHYSYNLVEKNRCEKEDKEQTMVPAFGSISGSASTNERTRCAAPAARVSDISTDMIPLYALWIWFQYSWNVMSLPTDRRLFITKTPPYLCNHHHTHKHFIMQKRKRKTQLG
jgi:hypothetical protein